MPPPLLASRHLFAHFPRPVDHHDRHDDEDEDDRDGEDDDDDGEDKHGHDERGGDTIKLLLFGK